MQLAMVWTIRELAMYRWLTDTLLALLYAMSMLSVATDGQPSPQKVTF